MANNKVVFAAFVLLAVPVLAQSDKYPITLKVVSAQQQSVGQTEIRQDYPDHYSARERVGLFVVAETGGIRYTLQCACSQLASHEYPARRNARYFIIAAHHLDKNGNPKGKTAELHLRIVGQEAVENEEKR